MSVQGDGCDAHPWTEYAGDRRAFDVSKLDQWELVFGHMTARGFLIHYVTQETENDGLLGETLTFERRLYYREIISRFGHHPALQWNLGEENTNEAPAVQSFSDYIRDQDPYDHPIFLHTYPNQQDRTFSVHWMNPRTGEHFDGEDATGDVALSPPEQASQDWVVLVHR